MEIIGEDNNIYLKKLELEDSYELRKWELYDDEKLLGYNYGNFTKADCEAWYMNVSLYRKRYFAVKTKDEDRLIAFIGLKNYNPILKKSILGIVFDPYFTSKGYGYDAMNILLDYYFNQLDFNELNLEVNDFNKRAINLYRKLGFEKIGDSLQIFENQNVEVDGKYFIRRFNKVYSKISKMKIRKDGRKQIGL